jgi:hypothetical protein
MMNKPFSQACENNKTHILPVLQQAFNSVTSVLEIGSGTGQHAVYFAKKLPHITWQTSDLFINHDGINQWITEYPSSNLHTPITLDLSTEWPIENLSGIYTANTLYIVSWNLVQTFFENINRYLLPAGKVCIYGPFNYNGKYTSQSNANFDVMLKQREELSGIRDCEAVIQLAEKAGLTLIQDHEMPANNRLLEFVK